MLTNITCIALLIFALGLHLVLNIQQDDYVSHAVDSAGVRLVAHAQNSMPFPEDEGLTVAPGMATFIGLSKVC